MANVNIYDQGTNSTYRVVFDVKSTYSADIEPTGEIDYYLDISTTMTHADGTAFGHYMVRTLDDVPPLGSTATDFSDLCSKYITYFMNESELIESSSSSSTSSSSSSEGIITSSSSSSSSSSSGV